jgi:hypothetical protein
MEVRGIDRLVDSCLNLLAGAIGATDVEIVDPPLA